MNQEIDQLNEWIDQLIDWSEERLASGEGIPEELKKEIKDSLGWMLHRVQELQSQTTSWWSTPRPQEVDEVASENISPQEAQIPQQSLEDAPHPSSNIRAFKYDPNSQKLMVKFMGKTTRDGGPIYSYDQVPAFIYDVFSRGAVGPKTTGKNRFHAWFKGKTPSHGAAMSALIKAAGYPYQRIS